MGIRMVTSVSDIEEYFIKTQKIFREEMVRTLSYLGEKCIIKVRDRSGEESWFDQTGNLRSSVGYAIYEYGKKQIESAFNIVKGGTKGAETGRKMVEELAKVYSETYALVVVAAMNYAEYVEAMDNKDVLAKAELFARSKIDGLLDLTLKRVTKRIEREIRH